MSFNFKQSAQESTTLSELMADREKLTTEELVVKYPDGVTITAFDVIDSNKGTYPVFHIKENDKVFYCGGIVLRKIVEGWLKGFNGDSDTANAELAKMGGVRVKLELGKTKDNNNLTKVTVL